MYRHTRLGPNYTTPYLLWFLVLQNWFVLILIFSVDCCLSQDELLAELDELEQEELDKNLLEIGGSENVPLPNVPSTSLPSRPGKSDSVSLTALQHLLLFLFLFSLWGRVI